MYEGYAPGGIAVLVECLTDNRNRAASDVRVAFTRNGGQMADPGSVSYLFSRRGVVIVPKGDGVTEDDVLTAVLEAGADEVNDLGEVFEVMCEAGDVVQVRTALQDAGIDYDSAEAQFVPGDPDRGRRGRRPQDHAPDRLARGQRRRAERVRQLRRLRRGHGRPRRGVVADHVGLGRRSVPCGSAAGETGAVRVLGVDPGLTRCGLGVVDALPGRRVRLVEVGVARSDAGADPAARLVAIEAEVEQWLDRHQPDAVAVERVFAQHNVRTVMGTAQVSGVVMVAAARRGIPVALHTPSEVKAAVTGSGRADKAQVTTMVTRILELDDATDPRRRGRRPRAGDLPPVATGCGGRAEPGPRGRPRRSGPGRPRRRRRAGADAERSAC